ncbi:DUF6446 family protein [Phaeovulum sp.]|uniref:DUF6446 family protein n=1 Tax=Phaeovulum sp. TaxID=2934796 RepID=UPI0027303724|nr:DUF6446 family protein [Phaeovulum sp.]MDP1669459.1 DUF6446 family protein [Phaeovulum sp.]MDZ4118262.1 DUF6446 family protein [Phaeovulum sp.]
MNGKAVGLILVFSALMTGAAVWYLQVYGYYDPIPASAPGAEVRLTSLVTGQPEKILAAGFQGIDADSSPLRFRACFTTPLGLAVATESFKVYDAATPLNAPGWFDCFNAARIGGDLEAGTAVAFLSVADITPGIDRVVAIYPDGRAYAWHQLNETAEK